LALQFFTMAATESYEPKALNDVEKRQPFGDGGSEVNGSQEEFYIDPAKEIKLLAKLDLAFIPIIMLVYLSCFLDRSNIGLYATTYWVNMLNNLQAM
jgi:hypothetical protein